MAGQFRNGLVAVTIAIKRICENVKRYGPSLLSAIDAALAAGKITSAQATAMKSFLDAAVAICDAFRAATGY